MSDHHVVCSTVLSTLSSSFSAYFKILKYRLIFLQVLRVSDDPLCESNIERRVKISAGISREGT